MGLRDYIIRRMIITERGGERKRKTNKWQIAETKIYTERQRKAGKFVCVCV